MNKCKDCIFYYNTKYGDGCLHAFGDMKEKKCTYKKENFEQLGNGEFLKTDKGKPTFELLPIDLLSDVNKVLQHGAVKYGVNNWRKEEGFKYSRCYNALLRHMLAFWGGEDKDIETGLSHLDHAMCNLLFLKYHLQTKGADDRPIWKGGLDGSKATR